MNKWSKFVLIVVLVAMCFIANPFSTAHALPINQTLAPVNQDEAAPKCTVIRGPRSIKIDKDKEDKKSTRKCLADTLWEDFSTVDFGWDVVEFGGYVPNWEEDLQFPNVDDGSIHRVIKTFNGQPPWFMLMKGACDREGASGEVKWEKNLFLRIKPVKTAIRCQFWFGIDPKANAWQGVYDTDPYDDVLLGNGQGPKGDTAGIVFGGHNAIMAIGADAKQQFVLDIAPCSTNPSGATQVENNGNVLKPSGTWTGKGGSGCKANHVHVSRLFPREDTKGETFTFSVEPGQEIFLWWGRFITTTN